MYHRKQPVQQRIHQGNPYQNVQDPLQKPQSRPQWPQDRPVEQKSCKTQKQQSITGDDQNDQDGQVDIQNPTSVAATCCRFWPRVVDFAPRLDVLGFAPRRCDFSSHNCTFGNLEPAQRPLPVRAAAPLTRRVVRRKGKAGFILTLQGRL